MASYMPISYERRIAARMIMAKTARYSIHSVHSFPTYRANQTKPCITAITANAITPVALFNRANVMALI